MSKPFDARDWYWRRADGALYASARGAIIPAADVAADAAFATWSAEGGYPTPWPRDADDNESDAQLAGVLAPYGLGLPGAQPIISSGITFKADVVRRCTDDEADALEAALAAASSRLRLLWNSIQHIDHGAQDFGTLRDALVSALKGMGLSAEAAGDRADELLAASE